MYTYHDIYIYVMNIHVYISMHLDMHIYMYKHIYVDMHIYMYKYIYTYVCIYIECVEELFMTPYTQNPNTLSV